MRNIIYLIIISLLFCSCKVGIKHIHKTNEEFKINKIGFVNLECKNILSTVFPQYDSIYISTVLETFKEYITNDPKYLNNNIDYDNPDIHMMKELCKANGIDGLILSRLKFISQTTYFNFNPVATGYDVIAETKLINSEGNLITQASYNLSGHSYDELPDEKETISDAIKPTLKRIANVMGLKKIK